MHIFALETYYIHMPTSSDSEICIFVNIVALKDICNPTIKGEYEINLATFLLRYECNDQSSDRLTDQRTNQPRDGNEGSLGSYNNNFQAKKTVLDTCVFPASVVRASWLVKMMK